MRVPSRRSRATKSRPAGSCAVALERSTRAISGRGAPMTRTTTSATPPITSHGIVTAMKARDSGRLPLTASSLLGSSEGAR